MSQLKLGIAGVGRIGKIHLNNLMYRIPAANVVAAVDVQSAGQEFASSLGVAQVSGDFQDLLDNPEVEAVLICSPNDTHADYVVRASNAGKTIFCEKPLDLSLDTVRHILEVTEQNGTPMMVAFNRRFDANFRKVREQVVSGSIGDPHILKITSRDWGPPPLEYVAQSGGLFMDMAIHDFDMARFIVGSEVSEVYARGSIQITPEIAEYGDIDTAVITLTFENGAFGIIDNSRQAAYGYDQRLEIFGSKGMSLADNKKPDDHRLYTVAGVNETKPMNHFITRYMDTYLEEMIAFVEAAREGKAMPITGQDGLRSMAVGLAAGKSVVENRPVKISEILG